MQKVVGSSPIIRFLSSKSAAHVTVLAYREAEHWWV
jgi:hypothetical protein